MFCKPNNMYGVYFYSDINKIPQIQFIHADTFCLMVNSLLRIEIHVWIVAIGTLNRATTPMTLHGSVFTNALSEVYSKEAAGGI